MVVVGGIVVVVVVVVDDPVTVVVGSGTDVVVVVEVAADVVDGSDVAATVVLDGLVVSLALHATAVATRTTSVARRPVRAWGEPDMVVIVVDDARDRADRLAPSAAPAQSNSQPMRSPGARPCSMYHSRPNACANISGGICRKKLESLTWLR